MQQHTKNEDPGVAILFCGSGSRMVSGAAWCLLLLSSSFGGNSGNKREQMMICLIDGTRDRL